MANRCQFYLRLFLHGEMSYAADSEWPFRHAQMRITSPSQNRRRYHIKQPAAGRQPTPGLQRKHRSANRSPFFCNKSQVFFTEQLQPKGTEYIFIRRIFPSSLYEGKTADRLLVLKPRGIYKVNCGEKHNKHPGPHYLLNIVLSSVSGCCQNANNVTRSIEIRPGKSINTCRTGKH